MLADDLGYFTAASSHREVFVPFESRLPCCPSFAPFDRLLQELLETRLQPVKRPACLLSVSERPLETPQAMLVLAHRQGY
jgi:hypothetical protein